MDIKQIIMSLIDCLVGNQYHFAQLCSCSRHVVGGTIVAHFICGLHPVFLFCILRNSCKWCIWHSNDFEQMFWCI